MFFDFTLNTGDTLFSINPGSGILYIIDTIIDVTLLNGQTRRAWYVEDGNQFVIEGIGTSQGFFFPAFTGLGWWYEENCVHDNGVHLYGNQCFTILDTELIFPKTSAIKIYPNPTSNYILVERENEGEETFKLLDTKGQTLFSKVLFSKLEKIDLSNFSSGLYFYSIDNREVGKLIIK